MSAESAEPVDDVSVRDNPTAQRFEVLVGDEVAGFVTYRQVDGSTYAFDHTEVGPEHEGLGLADRLVRAALADARSRGWSVLPYCPYVRAWLRRHPDHLDLVPAAERAGFDLA